jgi:hypothetical protein
MLPRFEVTIEERPPMPFNEGSSDGLNVEIDSTTRLYTLSGAKVRCHNKGRVSIARVGGLIKVEKDQQLQLYALTVAHIVNDGDLDADNSQPDLEQDANATDSSDDDEASSSPPSNHDRGKRQKDISITGLIAGRLQNTSILSPTSQHPPIAQIKFPPPSSGPSSSSFTTWSQFGHLFSYNKDIQQRLQGRENLDWALVQVKRSFELLPNAWDLLPHAGDTMSSEHSDQKV